MATMPFGKHKGKNLSDVPPDYLYWVLENCTRLSPFLRAKITAELGICEVSDVPDKSQDLEKIVNKIYLKLSPRFHPDRGGSHEAMLALNSFRDEVRAEIKRRKP